MEPFCIRCIAHIHVSVKKSMYYGPIPPRGLVANALDLDLSRASKQSNNLNVNEGFVTRPVTHLPYSHTIHPRHGPRMFGTEGSL